jgi:hypothetical protein
MSSEIVVALCALAGTMFGSILGILGANKLVMYRIEQLEKKVDKHNTVIERTLVLERDSKTAFNRIDEAREDINAIRADLRGKG